jgi:predicted dehydrogenase
MLKAGIIGCGSIARQRHAAEYLRNPNTEIAAVFDLSRPRAESMAADFGGKVYETAEQIIACLLYTSPSPRDRTRSRMPSYA